MRDIPIEAGRYFNRAGTTIKSIVLRYRRVQKYLENTHIIPADIRSMLLKDFIGTGSLTHRTRWSLKLVIPASRFDGYTVGDLIRDGIRDNGGVGKVTLAEIKATLVQCHNVSTDEFNEILWSAK